MKIDFINENKIKIIITKKEMESYNIKLHSFLSTPVISYDFIKKTLLNSNTLLHKKHTVKIIVTSIISLNYNTFIFFISLENNVFNNYSTLHLWSFDSFNDFIDTYNYLFNFCHKNSLTIERYILDNKYILIIDFKKTTCNQTIKGLLNEFQKSLIIDNLCYSLIKEKFKKI